MMGIVLTQGLKKQRFDAPTEPKVRSSNLLRRAKNNDLVKNQVVFLLVLLPIKIILLVLLSIEIILLALLSIRNHFIGSTTYKNHFIGSANYKKSFY